jgi:hypothetical protein
MELVVPNDVPGVIEVEEKDGTKHPADGKELYSNGFRNGFVDCWDWYSRGWFDPLDPKFEQPLAQEFGVEARGRTDGWIQCQRKIIEELAGEREKK